MTFRIPSAERRLSQTNTSQVQGNIYQTRNIDFDEEGVIKLAPPTVSLYDETDDVDFNNVHSIFHGSDVYMVGDDLFRESIIDLGDPFTNVSATDTTPPTPGAENDGVYFNGFEVVSDGSVIKYNNAGTWTTIAGTPTGVTGNPTALEVFPNQNSLLVGRGNQVARVNTSWTVAVTLTLPASYVVQSITTNGNYSYVVCRHSENGEAMMFLWTGISTTNDGAYGVGTYGIGAVRKYGSSVAIVDSLGRLLQFNGSGFTELASLPVYYTRVSWGDPSNDYSGIYNRGMVVDGDLIYLNIDTETDDSNFRYLSNQLGNVWCYDPRVGLYQRYSLTNTEILEGTCTTANINTSTDVFTVSGVTVPETGSLVWFNQSSTTIANVIDGKYYFVIKLSDTTMQLAETYENAMTGVFIDIGSITGVTALAFYFVSQRDYGQGIQATTGATLVLNGDEYTSTEVARMSLTGETYTNQMATSRWRFMQTINPLRNVGYFVTPKMFAENTQDQFVSAVLRFKPLDYGDKIIIKYRDKDKLKFPVMPNSSLRSDNFVSWTSSTVFTTTASPSDNYYDMSTVGIGDEVEIIGGGASGFIAHVANISKSGFQYTVTLDTVNPFYVSGDTSVVKIDNWKILETISGSSFVGTEKVIPIDVNGGWSQFKVIMEGVGVTIYDLIINTRKFESSR